MPRVQNRYARVQSSCSPIPPEFLFQSHSCIGPRFLSRLLIRFVLSTCVSFAAKVPQHFTRPTGTAVIQTIKLHVQADQLFVLVYLENWVEVVAVRGARNHASDASFPAILGAILVRHFSSLASTIRPKCDLAHLVISEGPVPNRTA